MSYSVEVPGRFYDCGEESIVYFDVQTGDTHLVSDFAAHIIHLLTGRAMGFEMLLENLSAEVEADGFADMAAVLPDILAELVALDIVEQE